MENQPKAAVTEGTLLVVKDPEVFLQQEEALQIHTLENKQYSSSFSSSSTVPEGGADSSAPLPTGWQEVGVAAGGDNPPNPTVRPGDVFHLTVMLEGGVNSSFVLVSDGSGEAGEEATPESRAPADMASSTTASLEKLQLLSEASPQAREKKTNSSDYTPSGITLTPSYLAGSGRKVYVPPPDPANLEHVGADSQGLSFWYDGGRNLYSCPATPDNPQRVPGISELSLVCKSMLQWSTKLKQLRQSVAEADSKLAQTMKDYFMPRVKSATQRQPKDPTHMQRLVPLEHLKQLAEAVRSKAAAAAATTPAANTTEMKPAPLLTSPFTPATAGGNVLMVPASTPIPVLPMFNPHFMFPSTPSQCLDKSGSFASTCANSPNALAAGGDVQALTVEQGLALAQMLFSTSGIVKTDLGQPIFLSVPPLLRMSVTDPVRVDTIDFMSKSIEISGETPIRVVDLDNPADQKACNVSHVTDKAPPETQSQLPINPSSTVTTAVTSISSAASVDQHPTSTTTTTTTVATVADDATLTELARLSQTHTSTEVMSAKMLLSLTGKEWCTSPVAPDHTSHLSATAQQSGLVGSAPGSSAPSESVVSAVQHSKRTQRKQKPIASARQGDLATPAKTPGRGRGKPRKGLEGGEVSSSPAGAASLETKRPRKPGTVRRRVAKDITQRQEALTTPNVLSNTGAPMGVAVSDAHLNNKASDQLLQELKSQQSEMPVKEYVIDTDSDSDTSSSGSSSDTGSSTEGSSSGTSSEGSHADVGVEHGAFLGGDPFLAGQSVGRKVISRRGHVVKIPRNLLPEKLKNKSSRSAESEDIMADHPLDLATLYAHQGTLDLSTLSEITQSSQPDSRVDSPFDTGSRSKRTCVRVREQIHRLREILEGDNSLVPSPTGRSKGRSQKRVNEAEGGASAAKRSRRSGYRNQFTHKRRKRRKKPSEDEPLWQSARKHPSGSALSRVYVFSTDLANRAAESVEKGEFDSIIQFHQAQPKGPGFFRPAHGSQRDDACDWSPGGDLCDARQPHSVARRKSAASSPGVEMSGEDCDARVSPASLPSRPLSRQSRQLKKQSSWAGSMVIRSPTTLGEASGSVGRTRKASPSPYVDPKSPSDTQEAWEQWGNHGNQRNLEEEHLSVSKRFAEQPEGKKEEGDLSRSQSKKGDGGGVRDHIPSVVATMNQSETGAMTPRQHVNNSLHRSEVESSHGNTASPVVASPANPGTGHSRDEMNYTICHGTPGSGMQGDISSPVLPPTRGVQQLSSVHSSSEASFSPHPHPHPSLAHGVQQQMEMSEHYSGGEQGSWNQYPPGYHHHHQHSQLPPGMSYPVSALQSHSGYPYPVSYPWGHHLQPIHHGGTHHQLRAEEAMHTQQMGYMHTPPSMMEEGKEVQGGMFLPNPPPPPPALTSDALPTAMSQASRPPPPAHHSPHGHHPQPGVLPPRHYQAIPSDYFGHSGIFPYGFEGAGLHQMHLWPQSHGGGQLPPGMHPAHMLPPGHGGWYPPQLVHSMVSGVEVHGGGGGGGGDGGKVAGKKGNKHEGMQVVDVKLNSNGNNNNNNNNNIDNKQTELRDSLLVQQARSASDCKPSLPTISSSTVLLQPMQRRWLQRVQKVEPYSVRVIASSANSPDGSCSEL